MDDDKVTTNPLTEPVLSTEHYMESSIERNSTFVRDLAADYDFCIVLPAVKGEISDRGKGYLKTIGALGFELYMYKNLDAQNEVVILLRVPLDKLRAYADKIDFRMLLDPAEVQRQIEAGDPERNIAGVEIAHRPDVTHYLPYQHIYGKYSRKINERLYWREEGLDHPFREIVRLKLCATLLERRPHPKRENLKIRRYLR